MAVAAPTSIVGKAAGPTGYGLMALLHNLPPSHADKVILSVKGAYGITTHTPNGTPSAVRASVETALSILDGVKKIDIFECARVDPNVPIETTIGALAELVEEGKIGGVGLSEVSAATIRCAHAVLNIPVVAYSPAARGCLTGQLRKFEDLPATDMRHHLPHFKREVFDDNAKLARAVEALAKRKGVTAAQVAIAWVRAQGAIPIPIPGATTEERVRENCVRVELHKGDLEELRRVIEGMQAKGERYGGVHEGLLNL
ncbi:NADP-dependent oxidoreductase domain-containing protein [Aspergillus carlsbadensis]|nr:NADP-dependent oxidoreductase domain-containing protein [Aspergillus carlsbadensis]